MVSQPVCELSLVTDGKHKPWMCAKFAHMPRRHIYLTDQANWLLADLSDRTGKSISEVVVDATRFYRWSLEVKASGGRLIIERDGKQREVVSV